MNPSPRQIVNAFEALKQILVQAAIGHHQNTDHPRIRIHSCPPRQVVVEEPASIEAVSSLAPDEHLVVLQKLSHSIAAVDFPVPASKVLWCDWANHLSHSRVAPR